MNLFRELFEKYKKGALDDTLISKLHHLIIETYFSSPGELNNDEIDYTEDLIIELYSKDELDENYVQKFKKLLNENKLLLRKFNLISNLSKSAESYNIKKQQRIIEPDTENQEEEEKLAKVLEEVIEQVHAEKESSTWQEKIDNVISDIQTFFKELIPPIEFNTPQVRLVMVMVSMAVLVVIVWVSVNPGLNEQLADQTVTDTIKNTQVVTNDTIGSQNESESLELIKREKIANLVAANFEPSPRFNYTSSRSVSTSAVDTLIKAAKKYNNKNFKECIKILNGLLQRKSFSSSDTISLINFYLGNSYLTEALAQDNMELAQMSLNSFSKIDHNTPYFIPSKWYATYAYLQLGQEDESLKLLDTLILINNHRADKAKILKDKIMELD